MVAMDWVLRQPGGSLGSHTELKTQRQTETGQSCQIVWSSNQWRKSGILRGADQRQAGAQNTQIGLQSGQVLA